MTILVGAGTLVLLTAWLPMVLSEAPLSLPILCVGFGAALFWSPLAPGVAPHPDDYRTFVEIATELVVTVTLMGAGLKIDRPIGWRRWRPTWGLIGVTMPLTIVLLAAGAHLLLGFGLATAVLIAAVLAPTDPVLASDIQTGPPDSGEDGETRFALTAEAGLNDALAFPAVHAAIALAAVGLTWDTAAEWALDAVLVKLTLGVLGGWIVGRLLAVLLFRLPNRAKLSRTGDGFVALGITLVAYGVTELAGGYGFLGVFVAALNLRAVERHHDYHSKLHDFADEMERLATMVLLVAFGGAITSGGLLGALDGPAVAFGLFALFVVRPLAGWIGLAGLGLPGGERAIIAFYGIRGIGSVYYLAYALQEASFEAVDRVWSTVAFVILVSILLHGATVTPVMRALDRRRGAGPPSSESREEPRPGG